MNKTTKKILSVYAFVVLFTIIAAQGAIIKNLNHRVNQIEQIEQARWDGINEVTDSLTNTPDNICDVNRNLFKIMRLTQSN